MDKAITFDDVLLVPSFNKHASRKDVDLSVNNGVLGLKLPIMTANMDTITESDMAIWIADNGGIGVLHRFMSIKQNVYEFQRTVGLNKTFVSVGCSDGEKERAEALHDAGAQYFCVDVAHGHSAYVGDMIRWLRDKYKKNICIMAGNVATFAGAAYLAGEGANIVKCGIGPGSVCSTRIKTGFGVPQLTAIRDCAMACKSYGVPVVADGGLRTPGDIVKALAFGASYVMIGGMLAGTYFTPGKVEWTKCGEYEDLPGYKVYRGMASKEVADEHFGGLASWRAAEGVTTRVPYRNEAETEAVLHDIIGGLRSGMTYAGAANIKELQKNLNYVLITPAGMAESHPHGG